MAERSPRSTSLFSSLAKLGSSVADLVRTVRHDLHPHDNPTLEHDAIEEPAAQLALPVAEPNFEAAQLLTQQTPGWHVPRPSALAAPSYAPAMTAFGIVFIALGAVTKWPLSMIGGIIFVLAIAKWIGELLHD